MGGKNSKSGKKSVIEVLVAGNAQSGKTTFFKQIQFIQHNTFSEEDKADVIQTLQSNLILGFKELLESTNKKFSKKDSSLITYFKCKNPFDEFDDELVNNAKALWCNEVFKKIWSKRYNVRNLSITHLDYCMKHIDRLLKGGSYTNEDILLARKRTTGHNDISFNYKGKKFRFIDVGGQRSERRHWDQVIKCPRAVVFFTSLVEWNFTALSGGITKLEESLEIWKDVLNMEVFSNSIFILVLNKVDLLKSKIKKVNFKKSFPEFTGDTQSEKDISEYIKDLFLNKVDNDTQRKSIQTHVTCALDTGQIKNVVTIIQSALLERTMGQFNMF